ncbi:MAG TPA: YdeI/OmpD-associated family protein [Micropruina sp.]|nr:YdeI/OmpD-associated family protein [Micropruina sp.]
MATLELKRTLQARGPAAALVLTDEEVAVLGGGKRAAVLVRVGDRQATLRLAVMGGENLIGMSKASRAELGVAIGDELAVAIMLDEAPREVTVPDELDAALTSDPAAKAAFDALPYTARKEFAVWVDAAKRPETRTKRVDETLVMLREGRRKS